MWVLEDKNGKTIQLKENQSVTIGRNNTDILLSDDASISRSHAKLEVVVKKSIKKSKSSANNTQLIITDSKSKYGTFLLKANKENRLDEKGYVASHMDRIRFGLQNHIYTIFHKPEVKYVVLTSGLTEREKKDLEKILELVGGKLCNSWQDDCTHLTTCTLGLTEKISCALASGIAIVNFTFWKDVIKAQEANEDLPDANNYIPPFDNLLRGVGEIALRPNPRRKQIFNGLVFYYFDECQFKLYSTMIKLAGGKSFMFNESSYKKSDCTRDDVIFVQPLGDSESQNLLLPQYQAVNEQLKKNQLRSIPASEIPLGILYCSLDQHCNPKFKYKKLLQSNDKEKHNNIKTEKILVPETQDWDELPGNNRNVIIPETVPESQVLVKSQKLNEEQLVRETVNRRSNVASKRKEPGSSMDERDKSAEKRKKMDEMITKAEVGNKNADKNKNQSKKRKFDRLDSLDEIEVKTEVEIKKEEDDYGNSRESVWDVFIGETQESNNTIKTSNDDDMDNNEGRYDKCGQSRREENFTARKKLRIGENQPNRHCEENEEEITDRKDSIIIDEFDIKAELEIHDNNYKNDDDKEVSNDNEEVNNDYDDSNDDNDENQYSSKWIKIRCKKNVEKRKEIADETKTGSGYKIKFVTLDELQGEYKPFQGKSFRKKEKPTIPIKRLTKEDFYAWVPPAKNN